MMKRINQKWGEQRARKQDSKGVSVRIMKWGISV